MNMPVLRIGLPVLVFAFLAASTAVASPLLVNNFSFETLAAGGLPFGCGTSCSYSTDLIPGWTITGSQTGQFKPGPPSTTTYFNSVPDGTTIAYTSGGSISQTVAPLVQLGVVYTLMVDVGVRKDIGFDPGSEALIINGNSYFATGVPATPGNFSTFTVTYTGLAADVGKSITIQLIAGGSQGDWDNVRLSDSTPTGLPEPASALMALTALALLGVVRRKRA
jgi:MYXO-CTERM domain-containing protein